jgi:hypothetical protein
MLVELPEDVINLAADVLVTDAQELVACGSEDTDEAVSARLEAAQALRDAQDRTPPPPLGTCPNCGCEDLDYGSIDIEAGCAAQEAGCKDCDTSWTDYYPYGFSELD